MSALARQTCDRKRIATDRVRACRGGNLPGRLSYIERIGKRGPVDISEGLRARGVVCEMWEGGSEILQQLFIRLLRIGPAGAVSTHAHVPQLGLQVGATRKTRCSGVMRWRPGREDIPVAEHRGGALNSSAVWQRASREVRSGDGGGSRGDLMKREMPHTGQATEV